jgi:hypothetical protein
MRPGLNSGFGVLVIRQCVLGKRSEVMGSGKARKISLGDGFGKVAVKVNGATRRRGSVPAGAVKAHPAANDAVTASSGSRAEQSRGRLKPAPKIKPEMGDVTADGTVDTGMLPEITFKLGDELPDGTIFTGYFQGDPIYTTKEDAPRTYTFNEAAEYVRRLNITKYLGHGDWRVPTPDEQRTMLFYNRAAIGGFDESGSTRSGWYLSAVPTSFGVREVARRFSDGETYQPDKNEAFSLRLVR